MEPLYSAIGEAPGGLRFRHTQQTQIALNSLTNHCMNNQQLPLHPPPPPPKKKKKKKIFAMYLSNVFNLKWHFQFLTLHAHTTSRSRGNRCGDQSLSLETGIFWVSSYWEKIRTRPPTHTHIYTHLLKIDQLS